MNAFAYLNELADDAELVYRRCDTAVKFVGDPADGRVGGYLVVWGSPAQRDLQGEYFTPETELGLDWYPQRPVLYHHGLDGQMGPALIGVIDTLKADDVGIWAEAQLDLRRRYVNAVRRLVERGVLGWSSGSLPHLVEMGDDGRIKRWPIVEGSLTPAPAEPRHTTVGSLKSALAESPTSPAEEDDPEEPELAGKAADALPPNEDIQEVKLMDPRQMLLGLLQTLLQSKPEWQLTPEEQASLVDQVLAAMQAADSTMSAPITPEALPAVAQKAAISVFNATNTLFAERERARVEREGVLAGAMKTHLAVQPPPAPAPMFTGNGGNGGGRPGAPATIANLRLRGKFANLSEETMSFIADTYGQYAIKSGKRPEDVIFTRQVDKAEAIKTFMLELADKAVEAYEKRGLIMENESVKVAHAIKSLPIKSDELDHTTQANFGQEWVHTIWRDQLWERARLENVILSQFQTIEMMAKTEELPLESDDPEVYYVPEDTGDADLNPSASQTPAGKIKTGKKQFNAKKLKLRTGWSAEEDEDSVIRYAEQARRQSDRSIRNAIDFVLANGDTETGTTNINLDGGTPTAKTKYLALNGLLKMALVTGTGLKLDAGGAAPTLADIRKTRFLMGREQAPSVDDIVLFAHTESYSPLLGIDEFLTMEKVGSLATALKGQLGVIDGMPVLVTAQMLLSASNGKVSSTANLNTLGRLVAVYKPNWLVGFRRQIRAVLESHDGEEAWQLHLSTRLDFQSSTTDSVAVLYNILV